MSTAIHKEIARRVIEDGFGRGDLDVIDELVASDSVGHIPPNVLRGPEGVGAFVTALHRGFPDLEMTVEDLVAEGEMAVARWVARGTHEGEFQGIPPTGAEIEMSGITIERIADGRIVEGWTNRDALGMLVQLGAIEPPTGPAEASP